MPLPTPETMFDALKQFGLAVTLVVVLILFILGLIVWILKWVVVQQKEIQTQALAREQQLVGIIAGFRDEIKAHTAADKEFASGMAAANKFQRDEHDRMISLLEGELTAHAQMTTLLGVLMAKSTAL